MKLVDKYYEDEMAKIDKPIRCHVKKKFDNYKKQLLGLLHKTFPQAKEAK